MRIAVFTNQFPGRVNTFFARDVRSLIDAGWEVDIFPIYPLDEHLFRYVPAVLGPDVLDRRRVHHVSPWSGMTRWRRGSGVCLRDGLKQLLRITASAARFGSSPTVKSWYVVAKAWTLFQTIRDPFDHVLSYWGNYAGTCAYLFHRWSQRQVPFSFFLHAGVDLYRDQVFLREKLAYADRVIVVCEFNRRYLKRLLPERLEDIEAKVHTHHLGVDLAELAFAPDGREERVILGVGSHEKRKGFDYLVRALSALRQNGVDAMLDLVGHGPETPTLRRLAGELGVSSSVRFLGWQPFEQVARAMGRATLLAHASPDLGDAVPTVIKEALALGTPVVATDVAGIPELLAGGQCGLLVPPRDVDALVSAIGRLLQNPRLRRDLATAGRRFAEKMFDQSANGRYLAEMLRATTRAR